MSQVFFVFAHGVIGGFAFQGFYSEAASPRRRCSQPDFDTPNLAGLRRGLARDYSSKAKIRFQSFFMLMTIQPSFFASS